MKFLVLVQIEWWPARGKSQDNELIPALLPEFNGLVNKSHMPTEKWKINNEVCFHDIYLNHIYQGIYLKFHRDVETSKWHSYKYPKEVESRCLMGVQTNDKKIHKFHRDIDVYIQYLNLDNTTLLCYFCGKYVELQYIQVTFSFPK